LLRRLLHAEGGCSYYAKRHALLTLKVAPPIVGTRPSASGRRGDPPSAS